MNEEGCKYHEVDIIVVEGSVDKDKLVVECSIGENLDDKKEDTTVDDERVVDQDARVDNSIVVEDLSVDDEKELKELEKVELDEGNVEE